MVNERKSMIKVRGGFSDRTGIAPFSTQLQVEEFDDRTRIFLTNRLYDILNKLFENVPGHELSSSFCKEILENVFAERTNLSFGMYFEWEKVYENRINKVIQNALYNEVLDIIEYICNWLEPYYKGRQYTSFDNLFEKECVGYRFVNGYIVQITDKFEIQTIELAANSEFDAPKTHINNALVLLADRENKDYKNCIKESISAIETMCNIITGNKGATLGESLKELSKTYNLDAQLKSAIEKLYAYTNNHGGIRHAEHEEVSEVTFEEAKLCLVICSGILNYLIADYGKTT